MEESIIKALNNFPQEIKNKTVVMNKSDFNNLKDKAEKEVTGLHVGENPKMCGADVFPSDLVDKGKYYVFPLTKEEIKDMLKNK